MSMTYGNPELGLTEEASEAAYHAMSDSLGSDEFTSSVWSAALLGIAAYLKAPHPSDDPGYAHAVEGKAVALEHVAYLRSALLPFAKEYEGWAPEKNGGHVFGRGERVADDAGILIGHLQDAARAIELTKSVHGRGEGTHRHKKRGTEYVLIGFGKMQAEKWHDFTSAEFSQFGPGPNANLMTFTMGVGAPTVDMREVAIYRSVDDGSLWARPREEFEDGRFEILGSEGR